MSSFVLDRLWQKKCLHLFLKKYLSNLSKHIFFQNAFLCISKSQWISLSFFYCYQIHQIYQEDVFYCHHLVRVISQLLSLCLKVITWAVFCLWISKGALRNPLTFSFLSISKGIRMKKIIKKKISFPHRQSYFSATQLNFVDTTPKAGTETLAQKLFLKKKI